MKVIETEINDFQHESLKESKISMANDIVSFIQPMFDINCSKKISEIKSLKKDIDNKKEKIKNEKDSLELLLKSYNKKDKERQLLEKIGKLIQYGLVQESMKPEMAKLLKSFENIPEEKIVSYLNDTIRILSQKHAKN